MTVHSVSSEEPCQGSPRDEGGMVTSEYAVGTLGACGIVCVLITMAPEFVGYLSSIIESAFSPIIPGLL